MLPSAMDSLDDGAAAGAMFGVSAGFVASPAPLFGLLVDADVVVNSFGVCCSRITLNASRLAYGNPVTGSLYLAGRPVIAHFSFVFSMASQQTRLVFQNFRCV